MSQDKKPKKKIYKRWWFWLIIVILVIGFGSSASNSKKDSSSSKSNTEKKADTNVSPEYKNAYAKAKSYMSLKGFSKDGLYDQLTSDAGDGFKPDAAKYAVNKFSNEDYKEAAVKSAKTYSKDMNMSANGVYEQLTSSAGEKFTPEQAKYAVDKLHLGTITNDSSSTDQ